MVTDLDQKLQNIDKNVDQEWASGLFPNANIEFDNTILEVPNQASGFAISFHHAKAAQKWSAYKSLKWGIAPDWEVDAKNNSKLIKSSYSSEDLAPENLCLHIPPWVRRDVETAKIFCEENWLPFPEDLSEFQKISNIDKQIEFLKEIHNSKTAKHPVDYDLIFNYDWSDEERIEEKKLFIDLLGLSYDEVGLESPKLTTVVKDFLAKQDGNWNFYDNNVQKLLSERNRLYVESNLHKMPYLVLDDQIGTAKKWLQNEDNITPNAYEGQNEYGRESAQLKKISNWRYILKQIKDSPNKNHIFFDNRTWAKAFLEAQLHGRSDMSYDFKVGSAELYTAYFDKDWKFLKRNNPDVVQLKLEELDAQLADLKHIPDSWVSKHRTVRRIWLVGFAKEVESFSV